MGIAQSFSRIMLIGPIATFGQPARGGYEACNLRLLQLLKDFAQQIDILKYPQATGPLAKKLATYLVGFTRITVLLLVRSGKDAAVHFTPLFRHFLPAELLVGLAARARGYHLTVDVRAGNQLEQYFSHGALYRWGFRSLLELSNVVTFEGQVYAEPFANFTQRRLVYLPNFVEDGAVAPQRPSLPARDPRLICVGTVSREKGIPAACAVIEALRKKFPKAELTIVGASATGIANKLKQITPQVQITLTGPLPPSLVFKQLDQADFFLFLTQWVGEGHSNALTEAMARGCVPIVTDHGFNRDVVGCSKLVVADRDDAFGIATLISDIWTSGEWSILSKTMTVRVKNHYASSRIQEILKGIYTTR